MQTIADFQHHPRFDEIREKALAAGSDSLGVFGGRFQGGYHMQQNTDEIAALVCLLLNRCKPIGLYGEIGTAAGGTLRFMHENVGFEEAYIIDNGAHPKHVHFKENTQAFADKVRICHADSRNPKLPEALKGSLGGREFDVIFIDADHCYDAVKSDVDLVRPHCAAGSLLVFHDTVSCDGVKRLFDTLEPVANFAGDSKPQGIGVVRIGN
jgi:cephalosporin hydroxylase